MAQSILDFDGFNPVTYKDDIVPTNAVTELLNSIAQWIINGVPGAIVYGYSRAGKSFALKYLRQTINEYLGLNWPCYIVTCAENRGTTLASFYEHLLEDINYTDPETGKGTKKRKCFLNTLLSSCHHRNVNDLILFIDDAQWIIESQYSWYIDIHTQLLNKGIRPLYILVGQDDLKDKPKSIRGLVQWPTVGRFMQEVFHFRGIETIEDMKRLLQSLDECIPVSETGDRTFTHIALEKAYTSGFRLSDQHEVIWDGLVSARTQKTNGILFTECPMQVAWSGLLGLLKDLSQIDSKDLALNENMVRKAFLEYGGGMLGVIY